MTNNNLKPCIWPQCGSRNVYIRSWYQGIGDHPGSSARVTCGSCGATGPTRCGKDAKEKAAEAWNNRPEFKWETIADMCSAKGYYTEFMEDVWNAAREMKEGE